MINIKLGTIGEHIVNAIRGDTVQPGNMSLQDLAEYRAVHREPLKTTWKGVPPLLLSLLLPFFCSSYELDIAPYLV